LDKKRGQGQQFTNTAVAAVIGVCTAAVITGTITNYVLGMPKER
jgi:hypothetical protein